MSGAAPATGIAGILVAPSSRARPSRAVPPGSVAELSCQKIIFDLQLADLPVQKIDLRFIGGSVRRRAALEDAHRTIEQLLLPVVDLVRVHPEIHRQLGDGTVAPDCRHRHLRLERRTVLLPCPLHVLLPRYPRFLGAGLHLSYLSHFRGPAHYKHDFSELAEIGSPYCEVGSDGRYTYDGLDSYWREEERFALTTHADDRLAGFILVNRWSALNRQLDHSVGELFVLRKYRRLGVTMPAAFPSSSRQRKLRLSR